MTMPRTTMLKTLAAGSMAGLFLLASGGCRYYIEKYTGPDEPASAAASPEGEVGRSASVGDSEPDRTTVVDNRPSARYRVGERTPTRDGDGADEPVGALRGENGGVNNPDVGPVGDSGVDSQTREALALAQARKFRAMGDIRAALAELERAIAINPQFTPALLEAGDLHAELGEAELAERAYAAAARIEPRNFDAQFRHASTLHQLGRLDDAVRAYLRSLSVRPNEFEAMLGLSAAYLEAGNAAQALPYAQRSAESRPRSGEARMHLGTVLATMDRHEEAVVEYRQAAELMPKPAPGLLLNMSESLNRLGRYAEMVGALHEVVASEPTPVAYERLGSGLFRLRRYDEALNAFNESARLDPDYAPALNGVAVCELNNYLWAGKADSGARERAVEAMRRSLLIDRNQPRIIELLRRYSLPSPEERAGG